MRLSFVTPLFPPDVHAVARYHKALVGELAKIHSVTALVYGKYPESVEHVTFTTIDKQEQKRARVFKMLIALRKTRLTTDVYLITNGPSTELPALILCFLTKKPIILLESDTVTYTTLSRFVHEQLQRRVKKALTISSEISHLIKPEIHPLLPYPTEAMALYEEKWHQHITTISESCIYVTTR